MEVKLESVDPKKAERWLDLNKNNRKLRSGVAEIYADDMRNGRWTNCPEAISFYADGDVADGQHRLWAIIESGTTQIFPIVRGLSREDGLNINRGLNRSLVDNARISGSDNVSNEMISFARATHFGTATRGRMSSATQLECIDAHRTAIEWTISNGPRGKGIRNAVVMSSIARAWYYETDLNKLKRYCDVINTGFQDGESESAATAMRNYLLAKGPTASSGSLWVDTFLKVQNSIAYFMKGKKLTVIRGVADEAYPLKKNLKSKVKGANRV